MPDVKAGTQPSSDRLNPAQEEPELNPAIQPSCRLISVLAARIASAGRFSAGLLSAGLVLAVLLPASGCGGGCHPYTRSGAQALARQNVADTVEANGHSIDTFRRDDVDSERDHFYVTGRALVDLKQGGSVPMRYRAVVVRDGECAQVEDIRASTIR